jgi:hypothetical protein
MILLALIAAFSGVSGEVAYGNSMMHLGALGARLFLLLDFTTTNCSTCFVSATSLRINLAGLLSMPATCSPSPPPASLLAFQLFGGSGMEPTLSSAFVLCAPSLRLHLHLSVTCSVQLQQITSAYSPSHQPDHQIAIEHLNSHRYIAG